MVLAEYLKRRYEKRRYERAVERGIKIGRARVHASGMAWYKRMKEAKARDEPFDEPPPFMENGNTQEN